MRIYFWLSALILFFLPIPQIQAITPTPSPASTAISWVTSTASLEADEMTITVNGKVYRGINPQNLTIHSDSALGADENVSTLEVQWDEPGVGSMRVYFYFQASSTEWWVYDFRTTGEPNISDWTWYIKNPDRKFVKPLGIEYTSPLVTLTSDPKKYPSSTVEFKNLRLLPNFNNLTNPTDEDIFFVTSGPLTSQTRLEFRDLTTATTASELVDPETLEAGKQYQVTAQINVQNTDKTETTDQRPVYFQLQANDVAMQTSMPYSLIRNHRDGAHTVITGTFTARPRNIFLLLIQSRDDYVKEMEYRNNWIQWMYPQPFCTFVNNSVLVVPEWSGDSSCTSLQDAIDAIPDRTDPFAQPMYTIQMQRGAYHLSDSATTPAIVIKNKGTVEITGGDVDLYIPKASYGIIVDNSRVYTSYIDVYGAPTNGLIRAVNNAYLNIGYANYAANTGTLLTSQDAQFVGMHDSFVNAWSQAIVLFDTADAAISNIELTGITKADGITFVRTSGKINHNLIRKAFNGAIRVVESGNVQIVNNTIIDNEELGGSNTTGIVVFDLYSNPGEMQITVDRNIFAQNTGREVYLLGTLPEGSSINFTNNLFYKNSGENIEFINIPNPIDTQNNKVGNPLFGEDYCLPPNSPAMIVYPDDYMGRRGACLPLETPTPTQPPTFFEDPPVWWWIIPAPLRNFLEQLWVWIFFFRQPSTQQHLLEGLPTPTAIP